ncbi:hypothetical protein [Streptomyces goshikiensis]|uniref:hypothetical protein n=1 Tax=Streptomyces goshikiensis TaxID=1942 RepID=UPI0036C44BA5
MIPERVTGVCTGDGPRDIGLKRPEPGVLEGVRVSLRSESSETLITYTSAGAVRDHITARFLSFIVEEGPITAARKDRSLIKPRQLTMHWHRDGSSPWELFAVKVEGVRLLVSGRPGRLRRSVRWYAAEVPVWVAALADQYRPTADGLVVAPLGRRS